MFKQISLRTRIYILVCSLCIINIAGAFVTLWYLDKTQNLYASMIDKNVSSLISAQNLETNLTLQKGLTTYFSLSKDIKWLNTLQEKDAMFHEELNNARTFVHNKKTISILDNLEDLYSKYTSSRNDVIQLYHKGESSQGAQLHWDIRDQFIDISNICKEFKHAYQEKIRKEREAYKKSARFVTLLTWFAIPYGICLIALLTVVLFKQILEPIRLLAIGEDVQNNNYSGDEIIAVKKRILSLIEDIDETKSELKESRELLIQSEKLAITGKLAAGVAHSVRNPLTSVKMRLFSLERSLELNPTQKEDLEVISEEIRHIDKIVQNFLEFARPPKLELRSVSPSDIVDAFLELLKHRIDLFQLTIHVERTEKLPELTIDPDQIKEAMINLFMNACDAVGEGGIIKIREELYINEQREKLVKISFEDNGPGIHEPNNDKIFQPFYTSKEEGSGLGLSIAKRIINEHNGVLSFLTTAGQGTTFIIILPIQEKNNGRNSNS